MSETTVSAESRLFLDDSLIADSTHLGRVWHRARKYPEPVLRSDRAWERGCPVLYGTVLDWGGRLRMWYCAWSRHIGPRVCYAESEDGTSWDKPALGIHDYQGSRANNIVIQSLHPDGLIDDVSVIDDAEDGAWPLKALYWDRGTGRGGASAGEHGIHAARSADGIHWETLGRVLPEWGDRFNAVSRKVAGKYVVLGRAPGGYALGPVARNRVIARTESADLLHWSPPELILTPGTDDPPLMEFYSATAFPYQGTILGSIERMHMAPDRLDAEIIWSADSKSWTRSARRPRFIEWGPPGAFDSEWINLSSGGPILRDGRLWFYYSGRSGAHGAPYPLNHGAVGLAVLRIDGFCSLKAAEKPGALLTNTLLWSDGELRLNVDPRRDLAGHPTNTACGRVRVEVRDAENHPIGGYSLDECIPLERNTVNGHRSSAAVRWAGGRSLRELEGKRLRLFFEMRDAHLYSFHAGEAGD